MQPAQRHHATPLSPYLLCWQLFRETRPQLFYLPLFQNKPLKVHLESQRSARQGAGRALTISSEIRGTGRSPVSRDATRY